MSAAAVMHPLFPHIHQKPLFFTFFVICLPLSHDTHAQNTHTSWLGVLPQPVICLMNNGAAGRPHRRAQSSQPTQINYNTPVIIPDSSCPLTWTSTPTPLETIRSQIHCGLSRRFPEGVAMVTLVNSQPRRFLCGLESVGCLVSHSVSLSLLCLCLLLSLRGICGHKKKAALTTLKVKSHMKV